MVAPNSELYGNWAEVLDIAVAPLTELYGNWAEALDVKVVQLHVSVRNEVLVEIEPQGQIHSVARTVTVEEAATETIKINTRLNKMFYNSYQILYIFVYLHVATRNAKAWYTKYVKQVIIVLNKICIQHNYDRL